MTNTTGLANIIMTGLNNPDCSFFTGAFMGSFFVIKWVFVLLLLCILYKGLEKLALDPFLEWAKKKIFKKK